MNNRAYEPAFPGIVGSQGHGNTIAAYVPGSDPLLINTEPGLTVMEEFTKAAMQGYAANPAYAGSREDTLAEMAVTLARETLAAIAKGAV